MVVYCLSTYIYHKNQPFMSVNVPVPWILRVSIKPVKIVRIGIRFSSAPLSKSPTIQKRRLEELQYVRKDSHISHEKKNLTPRKFNISPEDDGFQ